MGYSLDFRQRVLAYKEENEFTFEKTSEHFNGKRPANNTFL